MGGDENVRSLGYRVAIEWRGTVLEDKVKILCEELSLTRLALAAAICSHERRFEYVCWKEISRNWLVDAARMPRREWLAGREAILHYLRLLNSKDATEAIELLTSPLSAYPKNQKLFRGIYRRRAGKLNNIYERSLASLMVEFTVHLEVRSGIDSHCGKRGAYSIIEPVRRAWKSLIGGRSGTM